jgi:hypothetical protein
MASSSRSGRVARAVAGSGYYVHYASARQPDPAAEPQIRKNVTASRSDKNLNPSRSGKKS